MFAAIGERLSSLLLAPISCDSLKTGSMLKHIVCALLSDPLASESGAEVLSGTIWRESCVTVRILAFDNNG